MTRAADPLPELLAATLSAVAALLDGAGSPWWVIGSAAVALHGAPVEVRNDVDVLVAANDLARVADRRGLAPTAGVADDRFRSAHVLRLTCAPLPIEMFAELIIRDLGDGDPDRAWAPLRPASREAVTVGSARLYVPAADELAAILRRFGRPKDLVRESLLRALPGQEMPKSRGPNAAGSSSLSR